MRACASSEHEDEDEHERRDDHARPGSDVVAERPESVVSGRTLADLWH